VGLRKLVYGFQLPLEPASDGGQGLSSAGNRRQARAVLTDPLYHFRSTTYTAKAEIDLRAAFPTGMVSRVAFVAARAFHIKLITNDLVGVLESISLLSRRKNCFHKPVNAPCFAHALLISVDAPRIGESI